MITLAARKGRMVRCRKCSAVWALGPLQSCPSCGERDFRFLGQHELEEYRVD